MKKTLFVIATPIGNLEDISQRAIQALKKAEVILAEDTRKASFLLSRLNIKKPKVLSYHQHSKDKKIQQVKELLRKERYVALICDAGTPGISDPGNKLIEELLEEFDGEIKITPIPGPSALTAAASISGFAMDKFLFLGFPPSKKKRKEFFQEILNSKHPVVFYESPYRILKTLQELEDLRKNLRLNVSAVVCRELTKQFETIYRGTISEVIDQLKKDRVKGEFVVVLNPLADKETLFEKKQKS